MTNVILCGGSGTRLWPISRTYYPKQFYKMVDGKSLFQVTVLRNKDLCDDFLIVTNKEQYFIALDQLEEIGIKNFRFILEPVARNTAAAIAISCFEGVNSGKDKDIFFVTPSDHLIKNYGNYKKSIAAAKKAAAENFIVLFGIKPSSPETGYGYLEVSEAENGIKGLSEVVSFKEKPDTDTASAYISRGNFLWNSGMFMFKPGLLLEELKTYCPSIYETSKKAYENSKKDGLMVRVAENDMLEIEENSIDYALLEKTSRVKSVFSDIGWSDLGSFDSIYGEFEKDGFNNAITGKGININSKNNLIMSSGRMIASIDIEDLIIVDTDDALLVAKKGSSQNVKKVVEELKSRKSDLHSHHLTVHRPWGSYTVLLESALYKIKKISVKPGAKLSLQKHFHRSEHWIVTSGTALVTVNKDKILLKANESTYIPIGAAHRLENPGLIPLVLIEAQVGEYLKEDDIVRIEDDYDRVE